MAYIGRGQRDRTLLAAAGFTILGHSAEETTVAQWFYGGPGISTVDGDNDVEHAQAGVIVAGEGFGDTQGTGVVELGDGPDHSTASLVAQTVTAWAANSITITVSLGGQTPGTKYLFVTDGTGAVSPGRAVLVHRATAVKLSPSTNITAGAVDSTTARLTAPTGSFVAGDRTDDTNPVGPVALTAGAYTEVEASVVLTAAAAAGQTYEFRLVVVADDGTVAPPDTISATPAITVSGTVATATPEPIVSGRRRLANTGRAILARAPQATSQPAPTRRPLVSRLTRRPTAGRAIVVDSPGQTAPARPRPIVSGARRAATAGRAIIERNPQPPAPTGRRPLVLAGRRLAGAGRAIIARAPQAPDTPTRSRPPAVVVARSTPTPGRARLLRAPAAPQHAYSLLNTIAASSADPHNLTVTGATAGRDIYLVVNSAATTATPAGWELVTSRVATMGTYVFRLPGTSNPGGSIGVTLDLSAARAAAVVAIQAPYTDTATTYASLIAPINSTTAWGTGSHTFTAHESVFAIFAFHQAGTPPTFSVTGYDQGFTALADTGWAGTGGGGDEAARILIGSADGVGFTASGVQVTLDAAANTGSAVGFLAINAGVPPTTAPAARQPLIIATTRRAVTAGRTLLGRAPQVQQQATTRPAPLVIGARRSSSAARILLRRNSAAPAPTTTGPRRPIIVGPRRALPPGRVVVRRNPAAQTPLAAAARRPLVVVARASRRAQQILTLRSEAPAVSTVAVPPAPQVTEPRSRFPRPLPAIITRNPAAPAAPATTRRPALVVAARAGRPLARIIQRRNPAAPAPTRRATPIVVADAPRTRRKPTAPAILRTRPPFIAGPGARPRLPLLIAAPRPRPALRRPLVLGTAPGGDQLFVGGLNVLLQIQTLTRVRPSSSIDAYGNTVLGYGGTATRTSFIGWMQQDMRVEARPDGRNPAEQRWLLVCNLADLDTDDRIEWPSGHPSGPLVFAVEGPPEPAYRPPGTGAGGFHHSEATLRLLEG